MLESLFEKVQALKPATLLKRDTNTGTFLLMLRNFNTDFEGPLRTAASKEYVVRVTDSN